MPRTHTSARQKNKPFKGKKSAKTKNGPKTAKTKRIAKKSSSKKVKQDKQQILIDRKNKKINKIEKLAAKNQYLDQNSKSIIKQQMKQQNQIKTVLLLPCNADAQPSKILEQIYNMVNNKNFQCKVNPKGLKCPSLQIFPIQSKTFIKSNFHIISPERDLEALQDLAKIADIICPILSCKSTNTQGIDLNPHQQGKAFDEIGYFTLNILRNLGLPSTIGIIQHMQMHEQRHHDKINKLFKRFFTSQLGQQIKYVNVACKQSDSNKLLRLIDACNVDTQVWKTQRGYMFAQNIVQNMSNVSKITVDGFLKGNCINANQIVHVTGFAEYEIQRIQILPHPGKKAHKKSSKILQEENNLVQFSTEVQNMYPYAKKQNQAAELDLINALQSLKLGQQNQGEKGQMQNQQQQFQDMSDQEDMMSGQQDLQNNLNQKAQEKAKRIEMQMRKEDQLQFQDEVQYAVQEQLRQKYREYQGLKSFKQSQWNHLENLPDFYDRIYNFRHYNKTAKNVIQQNEAKGFAYPGFYVRVTIKDFPINALDDHLKRFPLTLTFLHTHERKMTVLHAKVKRNPYYPQNGTIVQSNKKYMISMGFRRIQVKPIFSLCINGTQKTKYVKKIKEDYQNYFYCSFYYYNYFPPAPVLIYSYSMDNLESSPIMYGTLTKCDPMQVILERIILTGYPYKINRRRSTVRFMFFNPKDVKYFKPIQIKTKMGLRGKIEQSLGTHGLMKCFFNDKIKHNDTVCMHLYRRVYPTSPFD